MKKTKIFLIMLFFTLLLVPFAVHGKVSIEEKCFNDLNTNIKKIGVWNKGYDSILEKKYSDIKKNFSKLYKNMSSFGIGIDKPLFEMRFYSFGRDTGYKHPPFSPFPSYTKTEKWDKNSKEFIIAEEYIKLPNGKSQFLSCSFMQIESEDLMNVTSEKYLYDGDIISVIQNKKDGYKAWYNENISYDHSNQPFVTWKRLFIFPEETKNDYFNKYEILENFPTNKIDDFSNVFSKKEKTKGVDGEVRIYQTDKNGNFLSAVAPKALMPVKKEGFDKVFALNSYYQSIENTFPEFSKRLAIRGVLHYDTFKKILATKKNKSFAHIWNTVFNTREITKYALKKQNKTLEKKIDFYEEQLTKIPTIEKEVKELLIKHKEQIEKEREEFIKNIDNDLEKTIEKNNNVSNLKTETNNKIKKETNNGNNTYLYFIILMILLVPTIYIIFKRKK